MKLCSDLERSGKKRSSEARVAPPCLDQEQNRPIAGHAPVAVWSAVTGNEVARPTCVPSRSHQEPKEAMLEPISLAV